MEKDVIGNIANQNQAIKPLSLMEQLKKQLAFHQSQVTRIEGLIADYTPEFEAYATRLQAKL